MHEQRVAPGFRYHKAMLQSGFLVEGGPPWNEEGNKRSKPLAAAPGRRNGGTGGVGIRTLTGLNWFEP